MIRTMLVVLATLLLGGEAAIDPQAILIRGARVFDGTGAPATIADVLLRGDRIVAVSKRIRAPRAARIVEARGLTLLPGLHDLHTHLRSPALAGPDDLGKAYAGYLLAGVTTATDFSISGEMIAPIRTMTASGAVTAPRLALAIRLGVPGGHGTENGWGSAFTLEAATPRAAQRAMAQALRYRPDVIKVFADGWRYGRGGDLNGMDQATLSTIVRAAHAVNVPVITHSVTLAGAKIAAAAGVDAIGHGVGDSPVDQALIDSMRANHTAYVPTLVVYEPQQDRRFDSAEWQALLPPERAREERRTTTPIPPLEVRRWAVMQDNVRRLAAAGVRIAVGTDAGIGGVYHGTSTQREIRLLATLGLSPRQALAAATGGAAAVLRRANDQGRIAVGQRADLLLVAGRPDERIADLHQIRRVFVAGREMPLASLRALAERATPSPLPVTRMTGPIDTGRRGDGRTDLDTLPVDSSEAGADHSVLDMVRDDGATHRPWLLVARLGAADRPHAQLAFPFTPGAVTLADARAFTGVAVSVRGPGRYRLLLDSYAIDQRAWFAAPVTAGATRREVRIPFAALTSTDPAARFDPAALRAVAVRLEGEPGERVWLELSNLRFY
jgi:imidazolonepropionase-like amidohydrolase